MTSIARLICALFVEMVAMCVPSLAGDPATVLRLDRPVSLTEGHEVTQRLGQIEFAATKCGYAVNASRIELLVKKQMESFGAGGTFIYTDELAKKAAVLGFDVVCTGLLRMYGPRGSVIADAVTKR